jgi:hypothetical protein
MALQLRRGTNAERLMITPQQGELIFVTDYLAVNITGTTIESNLQTITFSASHNITVLNTKLLYQGATQLGLTQGTVYYVKSIPAVNQLTLSTTSGGTTLNMTAGTGLTLTFNKTPTNAQGTPVGNVSPLWIGNGTTVGGVAAQVSVLDDLLDVTITSAQEGQTLYYDATSGQWINTDILTIDDTSSSKNIVVNGTGVNLFTSTNTNTNTVWTPVEVRSITTASPAVDFGSAISYSANNSNNELKNLGLTMFSYSDLTPSSEDANFKVKLIRAGENPLALTTSYLHQFRIDSLGNVLTAKDLTLNKDKEYSSTAINFNHPTTNGSITWDGTKHSLSGDLTVTGGSDNQVDIAVPTNTGIANIYNGAIGTINIGNGSTTEVNIGNAATGRTQIKSPNLDLLGDIKVGGNTIKSSSADAIQLSGSDVTVLGDLTVTGNTIKSNSASAIELSSSDVTVLGDLTVTGNDIKSSTGNTAITLSNYDVVVAGDLAVNGANGGSYADITTTKTQAQLFPANATTVNLATVATALSVGAGTGTTTINNNATVTGDVTVNGGNININGVADGTTQPFLTFQTQLDNNTKMYGVRGKSATDDAWFIGGGSAGDDLGYLELATGDNAGGSNTGGQIYVRQYNNGSNTGVPWEVGGTGTVVNELVLLDDVGDTSIPHNLTVGGNLTVNGTTTTVNSTTLTVDDKNIELASVASPSDLTASGGGITIKGSTDKTIIWNNSTKGFEFNQPISTTGNIYSDGTLVSLNQDATGTPSENAYFRVIRGSSPYAELVWDESIDRWRYGVNGVSYISMPNQALDTTNSPTFNNLTLNGTTLLLNNDTTGTPSEDVKIEVERGDSTNAYLKWNETSENWDVSNGLVINPVGNGGLTINGNGYIYSSSNLALTLSGQDVYVAGSLTTGNNTTLGSDSSDTITMNGLVTGNISFSFNDTATPRGILGKTSTGAEDFWFVGGAEISGTSDSGYAMIATGDNGTEPIYVRQYTGSPLSGTISKQLTLLDASGNTTIPNILTVNGGNNTTAGINTSGAISVGGNIYSYGNYGMFLNGSGVVVNNNVSGAPVNNGEFTVGRGNSTATKLVWNEGTDRWTFTNDGTTYTNMPVATDKPTYAGLNVTSSIDSTSGALQLGTASNNHIKLTPNGTGNVLLESSTVGIGDTSGSLGAQLTTNGAGDLRLDTNNSNNSGYITITNGVDGGITISPNGTGLTTVTSNLQVSGNTIKKSGGTDVITFSGTNLTTFAGDIKLMGDSVYSSTGWRMFDYRETASIYGTSYQVKMNADKNIGIGTSYVFIDNMVEINTSAITTTSTATAVLDYFDETQYRSAKYIVQISNGSTHQMWEGMVIHDGTNIYLSAYGDLRTNGNLATMSVGFNATTGHPELRVTPVNATTTKFKATKTYIAV